MTTGHVAMMIGHVMIDRVMIGHVTRDHVIHITVIHIAASVAEAIQVIQAIHQVTLIVQIKAAALTITTTVTNAAMIVVVVVVVVGVITITIEVTIRKVVAEGEVVVTVLSFVKHSQIITETITIVIITTLKTGVTIITGR